MTPEDRAQVDGHFKAIHEIMCRNSMVKMDGGWSHTGWTADGRPVRHKFSVGGYERTGPTVEREREARGMPLKHVTNHAGDCVSWCAACKAVSAGDQHGS